MLESASFQGQGQDHISHRGLLDDRDAPLLVVPHGGGVGAPRRVGEGRHLVVILGLLPARRFGRKWKISIKTGEGFNNVLLFFLAQGFV